MKISHSNITYFSESFDDPDSGSAGLRLFITGQEAAGCVATITFWDASGQFFIEMGKLEMPLDVIEALIAEVKQQIPTS